MKKFNKYHAVKRRVLAFIIDGLLTILPFYAIFANIGLNHPNIVYGLSFIQALLPGSYSVFMHYKYGQTLGKMAVNINVRDNEGGGNISMEQAVLRSIPIIISSLIRPMTVIVSGFYGEIGILTLLQENHAFLNIVWWLAELITMFTNPERRTIHDYMAKTVVVKDSQLVFG